MASYYWENGYQRPAARLTWALRQRQRVPLSPRTLLLLSELDATRTEALLQELAAVVPIQPTAGGWLARAEHAPLQHPTNAAQRAAVATWLLYDTPLTVRQCAELLGLRRNSAFVLLWRLSMTIPIWDDDSQRRRGYSQAPCLWRSDPVDPLSLDVI